MRAGRSISREETSRPPGWWQGIERANLRPATINIAIDDDGDLAETFDLTHAGTQVWLSLESGESFGVIFHTTWYIENAIRHRP